jgi:hypothetical protein
MSIVVIYPSSPELCKKLYDVVKEFLLAEHLPLDIFEKQALVKIAKAAIADYDHASLNHQK